MSNAKLLEEAADLLIEAHPFHAKACRKAENDITNLELLLSSANADVRRLCTYALSIAPLRDYFAAQFMSRAQSLSEERNGTWDPANVAHCAYEMADAMMKERGL